MVDVMDDEQEGLAMVIYRIIYSWHQISRAPCAGGGICSSNPATDGIFIVATLSRLDYLWGTVDQERLVNQIQSRERRRPASHRA
jgi:hypothetical protein